MIAPGYAAAGFAGARAIVSLGMAATVSLIFLVTRSLFGARAGNFVFLLATFASPLPIYANAVFPDSVAPFAVAAASPASSPKVGLLGSRVGLDRGPALAASAVPALSAVLAFAISMRGGFSPGRAGLSFGPLAASIAFLLAHFRSLFGTASLAAAYGPGFASDVSVDRVPLGAIALLLDRQFGLLLFAPVLLLGLAGASSLWKREWKVALVALAVSGVQLGTGGAFSMWWGGASAPARFLTGALPALLILCAASFEESKERRPVLGAAGGFSLGLLWLACLAPRALHNRADGESGLLRLLAPVLDLDRFFPGFVVPDGGLILPALWAVAVAAAIMRPRRGLWVAAMPIAFAGLTSAKPLLDPFPAALRALEAWEDHRRTFGGVDAKSAFSLDVPLGGSPWEVVPGARLYSRRFSLPEGAWVLDVESRSESTPDALNVARVSLVRDDEKDAPIVAVPVKVDETGAEAGFDLPQAERRVRVKGEGLQSRSTILRVRLTPRPDGR